MKLCTIVNVSSLLLLMTSVDAFGRLSDNSNNATETTSTTTNGSARRLKGATAPETRNQEDELLARRGLQQGGGYGKGNSYGKGGGQGGKGWGKGGGMSYGKGNTGKGYYYPASKSGPPKGSKGGAPKGGSKGGGWGPAASACQQIPVYFYLNDLRAGYHPTASIGGGFDSVPFYSTDTGAHLGYYSDSATVLPSKDCVGSGSYSFGSATSSSTTNKDYPSQISLQFTCFGAYNSITGGNGQFGCASGYETFSYQDSQIVASVLHLCGSLCPWN